jgi:two-component system KDP operon response regulator KdpE
VKLKANPSGTFSAQMFLPCASIIPLQGDNQVLLTPTEYEILRLLLQNAGKVLAHHQLLRQVWGRAHEEEMHIQRVNLSNLRRKIESDPSRPHYLLTELDVGYRLRV